MAKKFSTPKPGTTTAVDELIAIKRLMIFSLLQSGSTQKEVAGALGVDQSSISRMFPGGLPKRSGKGL